MCLYPKLIKNRKYTVTKKNGGNIPPVTDERVKFVPIGCQNCIECRKAKAREWQIRLLEDLKEHKNGKFITLTFSDTAIKELTEAVKKDKISEGYDLDNDIATIGVRRFMERWRKEHKKSVRHWLITELGHNGTENIHIHGIIWTNESKEHIENHWKYGHVWMGTWVNEQTVNYIIKYVHKQDEIHTGYKSKILTSAGIGGNYTKNKYGDWNRNKYKKSETNETYKTRTGHKVGLPIYWRNKIYSEEEREKLWIEKLDKEERWILGTKIDVSQGEEIYLKALKEAQRKNDRLGYGSDKKDWTQEQYEKERRNLMQAQRIAKANKKNR